MQRRAHSRALRRDMRLRAAPLLVLEYMWHVEELRRAIGALAERGEAALACAFTYTTRPPVFARQFRYYACSAAAAALPAWKTLFCALVGAYGAAATDDARAAYLNYLEQMVMLRRLVGIVRRHLVAARG